MNDQTQVDTTNATPVPMVAPFDPTGPQIAAKFIEGMFGATTEHDVHICRYGNDGEDLPFRKINTREPAAIGQFVKQYD
jgi:hypothetical protein